MGNEFSADVDYIENGCATIGTDNTSSPVYNKNNLKLSTSHVRRVKKKPGSKFTEFHNIGIIDSSGRLDIDLSNTDFYLDGGSYKSYELNLNGKDFYSNNGTFEVRKSTNLYFYDFINVSGTNIDGSGSMTLYLKGRFSNNSELNITRTNVSISSDFYNGVDHSSSQEYFSGNITLDKGSKLTIYEGDFFSEGVDNSHRSKVEIKDGTLKSNTLTNGPYSDIFISSAGSITADHLINQGNFYAQSDTSRYISFYGNIANKTGGQIHLKAVSLSAGKSFTSEPGSKIYFSGITDKDALGVYGNIKATNISIKGAALYFSKGEALANAPYDFLIATSTLDYSPSLLGKKSVLSDDGTPNEFYEAVIEASDDGKKLKVTFEAKENVNIQDNIEKTTIAKIPGIADKYTSDEIALIDTFSKENPIPGFDIKTLGTNQIKTISKNISDGLQSYTHSKDAALSTGFEAIKTNLFARMIGGGNSPSVSHRSAILPYSSSVHYAANTAKSNYPATKASDYTQSDVIAYAPNTNSKDNNLYVNLLGALQTSPGGYGYNYGLSVGYDRNFDDKLFVGVYLAYIGGSLSFDTLSTQTQGFEAGVYARFKTSIFETDMILNQGYAYNKTHKNITILTDTYSTYSHYGTQSYDLLLQSGPRFDFGKNTIKPYIGLNINLNTGGDIDEDAQALASSYHFKDNLYLSESIGIEYKRLFKQGYFFIRPSYEANIWSNASETQVLFLNNTISIAIPPKEMFGSVLLGGEVAINNSLLLNLNASAKASNQKTFIATGMASLKYVF